MNIVHAAPIMVKISDDKMMLEKKALSLIDESKLTGHQYARVQTVEIWLDGTITSDLLKGCIKEDNDLRRRVRDSNRRG